MSKGPSKPSAPDTKEASTRFSINPNALPEVASDHENRLSVLEEARESSPLLPRSGDRGTDNNAGTAAGCILGGSIALATTAGILVLNTLNHTLPSPGLTYSVDLPYSGGQTVAIHNHQGTPVDITQVRFTTNAVLGSNKSIWGPLASGGAAKLSVLKHNPDGTSYYQIDLPQAVSLEPGKSSDFTFGYTETNGVLPGVAMLTPQLDLTPKDGRGVEVVLQGKCTDPNASCHQDPVPGFSFGGYFTNWSRYQGYSLKDLPVKVMNRLYYAFLSVDGQGNITSSDLNADNLQIPLLTQLREQHPYLSMFFSIGGANNSDAFKQVVSNADARTQFITQAVKIMQQYHFNGIDIDWEYPGSADVENFTALMTELSKAVDKVGGKVSLAVTGAPAKIAETCGLWADLSKLNVEFNVMTYDESGPWDPTSGFHSPLSRPTGKFADGSVTEAISAFETCGVPPSQILQGAPTYFRTANVAQMGDQQGLGQPVTGTPVGQFDKPGDAPTGIFTYSCISEQKCGTGAPLRSSSTLVNVDKAPYGQNTCEAIVTDPVEMIFGSGDTALSHTGVNGKTCYTVNHKLAGQFVWDLSGDLPPANDQSIIRAAYQQFQAGCESETAVDQVSPQHSNHDFINQLQATLVSSFKGGFAYTVLFKAVNSLTDQLFSKAVENRLVVSKENREELLLVTRTLIYLSVLYTLGTPILPAAAAQVVVVASQNFLKISEGKAQFAGTMTSFTMNAPSFAQLLTPQGLALAVDSFIASYGGAMVANKFISVMSTISQSEYLSSCMKSSNDAVTSAVSGLCQYGIFAMEKTGQTVFGLIQSILPDRVAILGEDLKVTHNV